jgi:translation initiation factor 2B subunit (eIF-2B alpha/beta/delta family)
VHQAGDELMARSWERRIERIRRDRSSGASTLLSYGIEAARLFLAEAHRLPPDRFAAQLKRFTLLLVTSQPSMAVFLTLLNVLWLACEEGARTPSATPSAWRRVHAALVRYADGIDRGLLAVVRRAAALVKPRSLVLTYSSSTVVQLALWRAMAVGRSFEVVCSESRPMQEGVALARRLSDLGISVHLVVDAGLTEWVKEADLLLLGADAILPDVMVNKVGTEPLLQAARHAGVPAYILADSSKWLPAPLARFWWVRDEDPTQLLRPIPLNVRVHNRYFGGSTLSLVTGVVWEGVVPRPGEVNERIARLPASRLLPDFLARGYPLGHSGI